MRPLLRVTTVLLGLPDRPTRDLLGELLEGADMVVQRGMLAGGLEAIGEDIPGR